MAIETVIFTTNGTPHTLAYNSTSGQWEKTLQAPALTSYHRPGGYYPCEMTATNTAGVTATVTVDTPELGDSLKLVVKEGVKPVIGMTSPAQGAFITNSVVPLVFTLQDEVNGSGIALDSFTLQVGAETCNSQSPGMELTSIENGYSGRYIPQAPLPEGLQTVTIRVSDHDGNEANQLVRSFTVDTIPPSLNITSPQNGFVVAAEYMTVVGSTNDATSSPVSIAIQCNGVSVGEVSVDSAGSFSKRFPLAVGDNTIAIRATDSAGKESALTLQGYYDNTHPQFARIQLLPNPAEAETMVDVQVVVTEVE